MEKKLVMLKKEPGLRNRDGGFNREEFGFSLEKRVG